MKTWFVVIIISFFWLAACEDAPERTAPPTPNLGVAKSPKEFNPLSLENRRLRNALVFLNNKDKYSAAQLEAVDAPKKEFFRTLDCARRCRVDFLGHLGEPGRGFGQAEARLLAQAVQELICVPLSINMPAKEAREELLRNIPAYEPGRSQVVVCYKQNSDMVIHIKNNKIIKIFD